MFKKRKKPEQPIPASSFGDGLLLGDKPVINNTSKSVMLANGEVVKSGAKYVPANWRTYQDGEGI